MATLVNKDCRLTPTRSGIDSVAPNTPVGCGLRATTWPGTPTTTVPAAPADHDGVGADAGVVADRDGAEDLGAGADHHAVTDRRVALARPQAGAAEGDALVDGDVLADHRGLADHDAGGVIDEHARSEVGGRVDVDPGDGAGRRRDRTAREAVARPPTAGAPTRWTSTACSPG